ncbi:ras-related protein rab-1a-like protein [Dermatophagoides farinae]|uniref:Ras-related protein rab-1a-like protein n=1 Tax=Dermatophagoides farinae TaxID=6954 RepID=A0A9D4NUP2_DERFA|nr:ras-related protein rab-1a-like protein [Dermatophagoides farinae]
MSSECEYEIDQQGEGEQSKPSSPLMINHQSQEIKSSGQPPTCKQSSADQQQSRDDSVVDQNEQIDDDDDDDEQEDNHEQSEPKQSERKPRQGYEDEAEIVKNCDENGVYGWEDFQNTKVKPFSKEEYERFQQPFQYGWKRELVLRCTGNRGDKKAGDVYYHTPNGSAKLRSYVEMNLFLRRNPQITELNVTNFTFAKQPIYRPPNEIVRHAMQRGANFVERPFAFNQHIRAKQQSQQQQQNNNQQRKSISNQSLSLIATNNNNNNSIISNNEDSNDHTDGGFGRGKRKRVVPSRYDDEEVDLPMNKRNKQNHSNRESYSNSNSNDGHSPQSSNKTSTTTGSATKMSAQERRRALQQQLYHQVNEEVKREKERQQQQQQQKQQRSAATVSTSADKESGRGSSLLKMKIIKGQNGNRKVDQNGELSLLTKDSVSNQQQQQQQQQNGHVDDENDIKDQPQQQQEEQKQSEHRMKDDDEVQPPHCRQPCSTNCPGRRNVLPNLMCYRCFCLFHLECVPDGVFLQNNLFACPNCVTDDDRATDESAIKNGNMETTTTTTIPITSSTSTTSLLMANNNSKSLMKKLNPNSLLLKQQLTNPSNSSSSSSSTRQNNHSMINDATPLNVGSSNKKLSKFQRKPNNNNESLLSMNGHNNNNHHHQHSNSMKNMNGLMHTSSNHLNKNHSDGFHNVKNKKTSKRIVPHYLSTSPSLSPHHHNSNSFSTQSLKFQPGINHIYRLAESANGRSVVIKDRTQPLPLLVNGHHSSSSTATITMNGHHSSGTNNNLTTMNYNYLDSAQKLLHENQTLLNETAQQMARTQYYSTLNHGAGAGAAGGGSYNSKQPINPKSKWLKYQQKQYLDFKDILNLRLVNRQWSHLLSMSIIWKHLRLNCLPICDWEKLGSAIRCSKIWLKSIDFTGVPNQALTRNEKICHFWKGFQQILPEIDNIELLKFGSVPLFVIDDILNAMEKQPWTRIHTLIVSNLFDNVDPNQSCSIKFLSKIASINNSLKLLKFDSNNGFVLHDDPHSEQYESILLALKQLSKLHTFECVSLKDFTVEQFAQLFDHLNTNRLKHLSIGSCSTWFIQPENDDSSKVECLFENLSKFSNLTFLRLRDVIINSGHSSHLVNLFESLIIVENLILENIIIQESAKQNWTSLLAMLKSLPLRQFHLSSSDPFTNRSIFESLIQLLSMQKRRFLHIRWSITVNIDDMGHCMVPLSLISFKHSELNDEHGKKFLKQYFGSIQPNDDSFQLIQSSIGSSDKMIILIEIETLKNLIITKLPSFLRKDPNIFSSLEIVPQ